MKLSPCPNDHVAEFAVDTTTPPFVEGSNSLEICVTDFAQQTNDPATLAEQACAPASVYVDNTCDVSQAPDAGDVRLAFGKGRSARRVVRYGSRPRVVGTLRGAAGEPIGGANVCVSARDRMEGASEVDIAEVQTGSDGKARVQLPKGANRQVKLTYWADQEHVEIRTARLDVRARPSLDVLTRRKLSDGAKARFRVELAGPYRANRKVSVQALAPAGWLDFPGCVGPTDDQGAFSCSYRFREQSGDIKYKFRAFVPRQRGYPYRTGRTRSKTIVVHDD